MSIAEDTLESAIKRGDLRPEMTFNQKVWTLTSRIPRGRIVTYSDIARALGTTAYRAVGNALNRNPYAPQVPCHRVVGSTGALTGFAGGLEKKRALLAEEGIQFLRGDRVDLQSARCSLANVAVV